jgi:hypothetical protein
MSLKRFSGWEPQTFYEYDSEGRLISSRPEVEWDDTEQGWMLALERYRRETTCPLCGYPKEICQAPEFTYRYDVGAPVRCRVTTAIRQAQRRDYPDPDALIFQASVTPYGSPSSPS